MIFLSFVLLIAGSSAILAWLLHIKRYDPFPRGLVLYMLAWGGWCAVVIGLFFLGLELVDVIKTVGLGGLWDWIMETDLTDTESTVEAAESYYSIKAIIWENLMCAAIPEELGKYFVTLVFIRNISKRKQPTFADIIICSSIVALGFQMAEDVLYVGDGITTALFRGIVPFHFTFGGCMGYFLAKAYTTGRRSFHAPALIIPILIHGLFDMSIYLIDLNDWMILVFFIVYADLMGLTAAILLGINRLCKKQSPA